MTTKTHSERRLWRPHPLRHDANPSSAQTAKATLEFGRFRVLLRKRQLLADGVPVELGTRALDLLIALLEADGSLVPKEELLNRVWPGIVVSEENLKVQVAALRKVLGEDRDVILTVFGRGYRLASAVRSIVSRNARQRPARRRRQSSPRSILQWTSREPPHGWCVWGSAG